MVHSMHSIYAFQVHSSQLFLVLREALQYSIVHMKYVPIKISAGTFQNKMISRSTTFPRFADFRVFLYSAIPIDCLVIFSPVTNKYFPNAFKNGGEMSLEVIKIELNLS